MALSYNMNKISILMIKIVFLKKYRMLCKQT